MVNDIFLRSQGNHRLKIVFFKPRQAKPVWDGEFHPCPKPISSATKSEPSDKPPQLIKEPFTIYKYYDSIFLFKFSKITKRDIDIYVS